MARGPEDARFYRVYGREAEALGGTAFRVAVETTDLYVRAERDLTAESLAAVAEVRGAVAAHIAERPEFLSSLAPLAEPPGVHEAAAWMYRAATAAGVGPMAAVAGAVARWVGRRLREKSGWVIVENGGDIHIDTGRPVTVGLYAGTSPFSGRIGLRLDPGPMPLGVCTSSATVGPSLSFGRADAATVVSRDAALADAAASGLGNRISGPADLEAALAWVLDVPGVMGALAICGGRMAALGEIEIVKL